MKKEDLKYDAWEKNIAPSSGLRAWFHDDPQGRWDAFSARYLKELEASDAVRDFLVRIKPYKAITLLYASKDPVRNHARVLQRFLEVSAGKK